MTGRTTLGLFRALMASVDKSSGTILITILPSSYLSYYLTTFFLIGGRGDGEESCFN
jgi:hypothetical protein